jgi:predicted metal-dependent phosphoesterase TrpH
MAAGADFIDLHSHSTASDGQYPPAEVAAKAGAAGVRVWGLTDHDTVAGQEEARGAALRLGMRFVTGIELSCFLDRREVHMLGHFIDPRHRAMRDFEDLLAEQRRIRMGEIVTRLAELGVVIQEEAVVKFSGGKTFGRPHVARAMVEAGAVSSVKEAFDRYLGEGKPAYVQRYRLEAAEAVRLVNGAGGVLTLAHPGVNGMERGEVVRLRALGLAGIEVDHPEHDPSLREKYRRLAEECDLVPTAGSDYHGEAISPDRFIGTESMAEEQLARLEARRP